MKTHTTSKTFASSVLLFNKVFIEIVSQLLGHISITITDDRFDNIEKKKAIEEIKKLNIKL